MKKPLSAKIKKLLEPCRYWDPENKKSFMPLVEYTQKLEERVKKLENELHDFRQSSLVEMKPSIFPEGSHVSRSFLNESQPVERLSRREIIWKAFKEGKQETDEFKRMIKWNKVSEDEAIKIFEEIENLSLTNLNK